MTSKKIWMGILVMALVFGMTVVGCDSGSTGGGNTKKEDIPNNSYVGGDVIVQGMSLYYYFANSVEGLQKAADDNGITLNPPLKNATWVLNTSLDNNVKQAMASRNASYCGTLVTVSAYEQYIIANKKVGNDYYITAYQ